VVHAKILEFTLVVSCSGVIHAADGVCYPAHHTPTHYRKWFDEISQQVSGLRSVHLRFHLNTHPAVATCYMHLCSILSTFQAIPNVKSIEIFSSTFMGRPRVEKEGLLKKLAFWNAGNKESTEIEKPKDPFSEEKPGEEGLEEDQSTDQGNDETSDEVEGGDDAGSDDGVKSSGETGMLSGIFEDSDDDFPDDGFFDARQDEAEQFEDEDFEDEEIVDEEAEIWSRRRW